MEWLFSIKKQRAAWRLLAVSCRSYMRYSTKYFQHAHELSLENAAMLNSYVFLAATFGTPLFGWIADSYGRRALSMVFASLLLPLSFVGVIIGAGRLWLTTVLLGISLPITVARLAIDVIA